MLADGKRILLAVLNENQTFFNVESFKILRSLSLVEDVSRLDLAPILKILRSN
jgi:hypothetical protein